MKTNPSAPSRLTARLREFAADASGGTMVMVALAAPAMVGLAGLAVEGGYAYTQHVTLQSVSDVAALSAARAITRDGNNAHPRREARAVARLEHPNIIRVYGFSSPSAPICLNTSRGIRPPLSHSG